MVNSFKKPRLHVSSALSLLGFAFISTIILANYDSLHSFTDIEHREHVPVYRTRQNASNQPTEHSETVQKLRLALCVSGAVRSLVNEKQLHNFIETFHMPLADSTVHTFLCLDESHQARDETVMIRITGALRPIDVNITSVTCDKSCCADRSCVRSGYEQFKRFDLCMDRILEREEEEGLRYDFIIRTRPDIVTHVALPRTECWRNLRRDIIWDGDVQFFGGERSEFRFGNILREGTNTFVDYAQNADSVSAFVNVIPRELAESFMRGIAKAYDACIPEVAHSGDNIAIGGEHVLKAFYGDAFTGGCGKGNARWRWDECRLLIQTQLMNVSLGRLQVESHTALARCRNTEVDALCADVFVQLTGESLKNVTSRDSCFPSAGYKNATRNATFNNPKDLSSTTHGRRQISPIRGALVDLDTSERLGGGTFSLQSHVLYDQFDGYRQSKAKHVTGMTRNLTNSFSHLRSKASRWQTLTGS